MSDSLLTTLLPLLLAAAVGTVVVVLATDDRDPSIVLAWLLVILLVPGLGVVAYFFVGRNHRRETRRRRAQRDRIEELSDRVIRPVLGQYDGFPAAPGSPGARIDELGRRHGGPPALPADSVRLYFEGADKFRDLLADLREARHTIHLMYLIWEQDELTAEVTERLLERLAAGVRVFLVYDWLSSLPYRKSELRRLRTAGALVVPCHRRAGQLNYRNHMKMAILDSRVVYSGGMNMGQEYIDGGRRFDTWRDTDFRLTGPVVAPYLALFGAVWVAGGHPGDPLEGVTVATVPAADPIVPVQVLHSSVSSPFPTLRDVYVVALTAARRRVWVQTPYFVPDEPLLNALCVSAASGVDVRVMITGHPDKRLPFYAAHAYFPTVLAAGVRIFLYEAGFLHAKTVVVDDDVAVVGTCNWDVRSLILHDEVVSVFRDAGVAGSCGDRYEADLAKCSELDLESIGRLGRAARARNSLARLSSRLL